MEKKDDNIFKTRRSKTEKKDDNIFDIVFDCVEDSLIGIYKSIKDKNPDILLLVRLMSDYHAFAEDAQIVCSVPKLTLENKAVATAWSGETYSSGIPTVSFGSNRLAENVLALIRRGYLVAVADSEALLFGKGKDHVRPPVYRRG